MSVLIITNKHCLPSIKLECVRAAGPTLRFHTAATVAITGAAFPVTLNESLQEQWTSISVRKGDELAIGNVRGIFKLFFGNRGG